MNKTRLLVITLARYILAITLIVFSIQQFMYVSFRPVVLPAWPSWLPGFRYAVYICSILMIAAALWLIVSRNTRQFAALLGTAILALFVIGHLPYELSNNLNSMGPWTNTLKLLAFSGCAFILAAAYPPVPGKGGAMLRVPEKLIPAGPVFLSVFLIFCGIEHFVYAEFVATLVPAWIPGHMFWTYFAAVILIGAGLAIIARIQLRLVATLLGIALFLWVVMLHIPRAIADPSSLQGNEWSSVFEALAYSAFAFVIAVCAPSGSGRPNHQGVI